MPFWEHTPLYAGLYHQINMAQLNLTKLIEAILFVVVGIALIEPVTNIVDSANITDPTTATIIGLVPIQTSGSSLENNCSLV